MVPIWLATIGAELFSTWREGQQQKRDLKAAAAEYKQQQIRSAEQYTREWELNALLNSGVWMRRGTLSLFSFPLFWAYFDPEEVQSYFNILESMPEWYLMAYGAMLGTVWGVSELRSWTAGGKRK